VPGIVPCAGDMTVTTPKRFRAALPRGRSDRTSTVVAAV
jgi:hypothetical protein